MRKGAVRQLVEPHGGILVDRLVSAAEVPAIEERARRLPQLELDTREVADLELIATGAASPLTGFLGSADYASVLERMRLSDGTVWPIPVTLGVSERMLDRIAAGSEAALYDVTGRLWGTIEISEVFPRDFVAEAWKVFRTADPKHPGVHYLMSRPRWVVGGSVRVLPLPTDLPFASRRLSPRMLRAEIAARGWRSVAGFQTRNPIHRAHEHLTKLALELVDGLVIHPLIGETKDGDVTAAVRFKGYEVLLEKYYPRDRTLLAAFPASMRYAGPREAIFHALTRKNYGITHFIVGRDHAGVGTFYAPYEAQEIFDQFSAAELGISPLKLDAAFFCQACDATASLRSCPHDASQRLDLSGTRVREMLVAGEHLPPQFTRPEIAEILREHYAGNGNGNGNGNGHGSPNANGNGNGNGHGRPSGTDALAAPALPTSPIAPDAPLRNRGFILWFTGLSGAGKSTLAAALRQELGGERPVEILDGDDVRTYLSKDLGFSKEDRDVNIRRIGYVARLLARNGVASIAAAISPYSATRLEVRQLASQENIPFIEVFAHAELASLVRRDVKGLYEKALTGEITNFTGISDPYEAPESPDIVVKTDREAVRESVVKILSVLHERGLIASYVPAPNGLAL
ncbi:MAG TPA: sulfate adenylyltransferase [Thermoanaerobaculia bacterium]|jgi:sulfate adenylyltransferase|nr:sulfate adenylyltransferase [Thermoanaerobaculia bacterium]